MEHVDSDVARQCVRARFLQAHEAQVPELIAVRLRQRSGQMKWWNNSSIRTKIALSFSLPLVLILFAAVWTYAVSLSVSRHTAEIKDERLLLADAVQRRDKDVIPIQQGMRGVSATRGLDGLDDGFKEAERHYQSYLAGLEVFRSVFEGDRE